MADAITGIVRVLHIFSAVMWVGGAFLWSMLIAPRILKNGPPAIRRPFAEAIIGPLTNFFRIAGGTALVSGVVLVGMLWGWSTYFRAFEVPGGYGISLTIGVLGAIAMAIVGFGIVSPTAHKMVATMKTINGPPTDAQQAQMAAIGKRMGVMSMLVMVFGTIAIIGMAWAVNVA